MNATPELNARASEEQTIEIEHIDWEKVGKIYKPESAVDHIINKEMSRLKKAFNQNMDNQDTSNEEKFKKKKWVKCNDSKWL